ncbi:DUF3592 domain-containing protein, partial [Streptomyces sp. SID11233]|nr:DUF3592 domain-containing protein [Streptomyces sp. SID11233]
VTTTHHYRFQFWPRVGPGPVLFEEEATPGDISRGDEVTVYYEAAHPEQATAFGPGRRSTWEFVGTLAFLAALMVLAGSFLPVW